MKEQKRIIHPNERSTCPSLYEAQKALFYEFWMNDMEIYDDEGNLIAVTSRDNPNFDEVVANCRASTGGGE